MCHNVSNTKNLFFIQFENEFDIMFIIKYHMQLYDDFIEDLIQIDGECFHLDMHNF